MIHTPVRGVPLTGVCINLWTWKANGFLAPFRYYTDGLTRALLLPEPHPGPPPNPKKSIVPKRETPNTYPCQGFPPALGERQQGELRAAVQELPEQAGIELANWNWRVVHRFVSERFGVCLCRSSCLNWLHRLGFAFKRPKKRLLKADESKRGAFVAEYAALWEEAQRTEARIFFADEAHFRAGRGIAGQVGAEG